MNQKEMMHDWVESMYEELHSWRFAPLKLSYVKKYVGSYARQVAGLVRAMKEYSIDVNDVRPLSKEECETAEAFINKQKQIIQAGGGLLELMTA